MLKKEKVEKNKKQKTKKTNSMDADEKKNERLMVMD